MSSRQAGPGGSIPAGWVETDLPMTEIGWSPGYDDPAQFSRVFRRSADMPPSRFRQLTRTRG